MRDVVSKNKKGVQKISRERMSWTQIVAASRKIRNAIDAVDANTARITYGDRIHEEFSYRSGGRLEVLTKDPALARAYRQKIGAPQP